MIKPLRPAAALLLPCLMTGLVNCAPTPAWADDATPSTSAAPTTSTQTTPPPATGDDAESNIIAATKAYNDGLSAVKRNEFVTAATLFEKVVSLSPNDASALMFLGYVRIKQDRYDDALTALERANKVGGNLPPKTRAEIQNNLGIAYWNKRQWENGIAAYTKAVELDKDYAEARYNLAFALLGKNHPQEAIPHLKILLAQSPNDATLQDGIGEAYENTGDWAKALGAYQKATALDTREAAYPLRLALALINSGRKDDAITFLKETLRRDPRNAVAYLQLGVLTVAKAREGKGSWAEAQEALTHYTELRPAEFIGWYNLGVSYDFAAKYADALKAYAEAEKINPNDPAVKNNIGRIHYKQGHFADAITACQAALDKDANFYDAWHNLALIYTAQQKMDEANSRWTKLIDLLTRNIANTSDRETRQNLSGRLVAARAGLAENYLAANKYAEAVAEYRRLKEMAPANVPALSNLALALYHTKEYTEAAKIYRDIIAVDKKNAIAYNNLGVVLEALNDRAGALEQYKQAVNIKKDYTEAQANIERLRAATATG